MAYSKMLVITVKVSYSCVTVGRTCDLSEPVSLKILEAMTPSTMELL